MSTEKEFNRLVHRNATKFRSEKIKSYFDRSEERTEDDERMIKLWMKHYGNNF